jgi:hypothetical protein
MESTTAELRAQVLEAYGGICALCGEDDPDLLQIDHVRSGGTKERKSVRGHLFYAQVIRQGFPDHYRLVCVACHRKVTLGQTASPHTGILHARTPPVAAPPDDDPPAQDCQEVAGVLRGVLSRMEALEMQQRQVMLEDHRALPAVRPVTPPAVIFEMPALAEAWKLQEAALESAHRQIAQAERQVFERWVSRAVMAATVLLIGAGVFGLYTLGRWTFGGGT